MAEAINYRMNLVIDPKNVIKANRELRAMERYFERIQGRVLKIGRTRMVPEIVLKDSASKGLDSLLEKFNRVKSQVIQASANVNLNVKHETGGGGQTDFSAVIKALDTNTVALGGLTEKIGGLGTLSGLTGASGAIGSPGTKEVKPKSMWDKVKEGFGATKSVGAGVKNVAEAPEKFKAISDAWKGISNEKCCCSGSGILTGGTQIDQPAKGKRGFKGRGRGSTSDVIKNDPQDDVGTKKKGRFGKTVAAGGAFLETIGSAGENLIGGVQGFGKLFGGNKDNAASNTSTATGNSPKVDAASSAPKVGSGIVADTAKGLGKRLLGPLGFAADVASIATAAPGKERAKAIGSTVGGGAGAAIGGFLGSIIPGAGTLIGSTLGGVAGSWIGDKAGGLISDAGSKIKEGASKVSDWFSDKFSFGKKKNPVEDLADKPAVMKSPTPPIATPAIPSTPAIASPSAATFAPGPYMPPPAGFASSPYMGPVSPYGPIPPASMAPSLSGGPRMGPAVNGSPNGAGSKMTPQIVQISPEQMTALSGYLKDFKTETTMNYNLPPGAVQVTVHEEYPVDVEGLIQQVGQRLRAEFNKAAQNRKPAPKAYV